MKDRLTPFVEKHRLLIADAFDYMWKNPETGYKEWKTHKYLADAFSALGYELQPAGNIPGFCAQLDTGRPGPTVAVFGEMDGLLCPRHPEADPQTGAVHACGHCAQAAALLGLAAALKEPGAVDGLCGRIRLVAVPAEELIEAEWREQQRKQGVIRYFGGKPEFLHRGLLDGVDMCFMIHNSSAFPAGTGKINGGSNGCMTKQAVFHGKAAHAGGSPHKGLNALYAANQALSAINALRETFQDKDHVRVHPILTAAGDSVNAIPDRVVLECYVRAADGTAIQDVSNRVNRAMAASAAALGCTLTIDDKHGYFPRLHHKGMMEVAKEAMDLTLENTLYEPQGWNSGCSDLGDMSVLMPAVHPFIGGSHGAAHSAQFGIDEPARVCVDSALVQLTMLHILLREGAARAKEILADYKPVFSSKEAYFRYVDSMTVCREAVQYREDGSVILLPVAEKIDPPANDQT